MTTDFEIPAAMLRRARRMHKAHCAAEDERITNLLTKKVLDASEELPRVKEELRLAQRRIWELETLINNARELLGEEADWE